MKIALGIEYQGGRYCGWQRQKHSPSVQEHVEAALSKVAAHPVSIFCAGRTDSGVHATAQVVHFETAATRPMKAWVFGGNGQLPDDISIRWAHQPGDDFHARFSALWRRYRYVITDTKSRPAILADGLTWTRRKLDVSRMSDATDAFLGEQNFASFQAASCQSPTANRCVHHLTVERLGDYVVVDIKANAFLHHMVRNIVGTLMQIGHGSLEPADAARILGLRDRTQAPETASPRGLYLVGVGYPEHFAMPAAVPGPLFLGQ